jgi:hypothetical protein
MSEFWQSIIQLILTPVLIVGALAFVIRELFKSYLSMDVERYKTTLLTDLESHKAKLKAVYDLKYLEFQTKFSLIHQKQAEAIENLYAYLAAVENDLLILSTWVIPSRRGSIDEFYAKTTKDVDELCDYFEKKRIYFNDDIVKNTISIVKLASFLKSGLNIDDSFANSHPEITDSLKQRALAITQQNIRPLMTKLEREFKEILSAETVETIKTSK